MSAGQVDAANARTERQWSIVAFLVVVVIYLAIIQGGGILARNLSDRTDDFYSVGNVIVLMWIPLGVALAFAWGVVAYLGWARPVIRDDHPVQPWVRVVPLVFIVAIVIGIDYGTLADKGLGYVLVLLIACQLVGWGEETMFRGLGVLTLRHHPMSEGRVALWSSLIFGAVHLSNAIGRGASAIPQAIMVSLAGYFFYLVRRSTRGNVANSILHGLFDFALISGTAIVADQDVYPGSLAPILLYIVLAIVLLVRRHKIELPAEGIGVDASATSP